MNINQYGFENKCIESLSVMILFESKGMRVLDYSLQIISFLLADYQLVLAKSFPRGEQCIVPKRFQR